MIDFVVAGDIESEWAMFLASVVQAAHRCGGRKVACCGSNTCWWTPAVRDTIKPKESFQAFLACGLPEAVFMADCNKPSLSLT